MERLQTQCCIVGGGPAGMMLGWLLARQKIDVIVLEKHKDFFRDFRGDTVHAATLNVMHELGVLNEFLQVPHQRIEEAGARFGSEAITVADFRRLPGPNKFIALMPQWDFLNFVAAQAQRLPSFRLLMEHKGTALLENAGVYQGVRATSPDGDVEIHADLVVACDGRHSTIRDVAGLIPVEIGVGIDVLWFQLSRREGDPEQVLGLINYGKMMILIDRGGYYQGGLLIAKGSFDAIRQRGLDAFQSMILDVAPFLSNRVRDLQSWDQVKLLTVQINRLKRWSRPGLLLIGDAAHAMSPAFGVGINLAIADAVAAANYLGPKWNPNTLTLRRIQFRREWPVRIVQFIQAAVHRVMVHVLFRQRGPATAPKLLKFITAQPQTQAMAARFVGLGILPELPRRRKSASVLAAVLLGRMAGLAVRFVSPR